MFRSNLMQFYNIIMPRENAYDIFAALGQLGVVQVNDCDPSLPLLSRPFANYIKRCDEVLLVIDSVLNLAPQLGQKDKYRKADNLDHTMSHFQVVLQSRNQATHTYFNEIEHLVFQQNDRLQQHLEHYHRLLEQFQYLQEYQFLLAQTRSYLGSFLFQDQILEERLKFDHFTGAINSKDALQQENFKRVVFRITKGNAMVHTANIEIVKMKLQNQVERISIVILQENVRKTVFVVIFPASTSASSIMKQKILRICETLSTTTFPLPNSNDSFQAKVLENTSKLSELSQLLTLTLSQIMSCLDEFLSINVKSGCSMIEECRLYALREKTLYVQLNKLKMQGNIFIGQLWVPTQNVIVRSAHNNTFAQEIENCLTQLKMNNPNLPAGQLQQLPPPPNTPSPTYFRLNDFTRPFQELVDLYGVPRYQEFNPAIFTCITFPFFFGIMFGDIGHGLCLVAFGLLLCYQRKRFPQWSSYRYLILLMGAFAFYCGLIYNEFFGLQLDLFGSCYIPENKSLASLTNTDIRKQSCVYPFGIDPVWQNTLAFTNSFKMKFSIIIAFLHMMLGLACSGLNYLYAGNRAGLIGKFIPQVLFLSSIFGYLCLLVLYKWTHTWETQLPPSIITTLIDMATRWGYVSQKMWDFTGDDQQSVQKSLMLLAVLAVPWMWTSKLCTKTLLQRSQYLELHDEGLPESRAETDLSDPAEQDMHQPLHEKLPGQRYSQDIGELAVHETIETIEFVLGAVSNTASYLRLWALSLAHSQLAEVFFELVLSESIENAETFDVPIHSSFLFKLMVRFPTFLFVTIGVLLIMDALECFLHSLRLHWVEFQSKFYVGDGIPFEPFAFKLVFAK